MAVLCVSFGPSAALCQADAFSSRCSARTKVLPHTCMTLSRTSRCSAFRWGQTSGCGLRFALRIERVRCRVHHLGGFFVFCVIRRQQRCLLGSQLFDRADALEVGRSSIEARRWQSLRLSWITFRVVVGQACTSTIQKIARLANHVCSRCAQAGRYLQETLLSCIGQSLALRVAF